MAAPASAAAMACSAIWSGVIGKASDMVGVWIAPVMAQVMMTLSNFAAMGVSRSIREDDLGLVCAGICGQAQAPFQRQQLPAETLHQQPPDPFGCKQHHRDRDSAEHQEIQATEIGQCLPQQKKYDGTDDRPFHPPDSADHGD